MIRSVEHRLIECQLCKEYVINLIYASGESNSHELNELADLMYQQYSKLNIETWLIGAVIGNEDTLTPIMKVWPTKNLCEEKTAREFNEYLDNITKNHCITTG